MEKKSMCPARLCMDVLEEVPAMDPISFDYRVRTYPYIEQSKVTFVKAEVAFGFGYVPGHQTLKYLACFLLEEEMSVGSVGEVDILLMLDGNTIIWISWSFIVDLDSEAASGEMEEKTEGVESFMTRYILGTAILMISGSSCASPAFQVGLEVRSGNTPAESGYNTSSWEEESLCLQKGLEGLAHVMKNYTYRNMAVKEECENILDHWVSGSMVAVLMKIWNTIANWSVWQQQEFLCAVYEVEN
ncbi:hypothetical protein EK904_010741 [Melospiza melodia maxima]|nr:hypothetical protein EK904_010741 [Melospiza melodia maxima]